MAAPCHRARDPRRQPPLPRRGGRTTTTPSGAIDYGEVGAAQVLGKLDEAARPPPRAVRALARDRRGHRLLLAQPAAGRRGRHGDLHRHLARGCSTALPGQRRAHRRRGADRRLRRRGPAVRRRTPSTSCSAMRCFTTYPLSIARSPSFAAAAPRRREVPVRRRAFADPGDRIAALPQARRASPRAAVAQAHARPPGRGLRRARRPRRVARRSRRSRRRVYARVVRRRARLPRPPRSAPGARDAGFEDVRVPRRGTARQLVRLDEPDVGGDRPAPRTSPGCGASMRFAATSRCSASTSPCSRAPPAAAGLLQPDDRGAQAVSVDVARARAETPGCANVIHLNNAGAALMPQPALDALLGHLRREGESAATRRARRQRSAWRRSTTPWRRCSTRTGRDRADGQRHPRL